MPVTVCRRAKTQPVATVKKLWKVGVVITQDSGCSRSTNDGTRDAGASLLNALVFQPRIVREASLVLEPSFHLLKKCESRTKYLCACARRVWPNDSAKGGRCTSAPITPFSLLNVAHLRTRRDCQGELRVLQ